MVVSASGIQHVDMWRKILLRKRLSSSIKAGAAYVPFIGDGDIAVELYAHLCVYGADLEPSRVATAQARIPNSDIRVADCHGWPFADVSEPFVLADFDAYTNPYHSFKAFWREAHKAKRLVLFFTDGMRQGIKRAGAWDDPRSGDHVTGLELVAKHRLCNFYWAGVIRPWVAAYIKPYRILQEMHYARGRNQMLYWGAVVER